MLGLRLNNPHVVCALPDYLIVFSAFLLTLVVVKH